MVNYLGTCGNFFIPAVQILYHVSEIKCLGGN